MMAPLNLNLGIPRQPDLASCGPTCLQAVYQHYGDPVPLDQVIREVGSLEEGGTLAVLLAIHALDRGYRATLYTYNLRIFDPTWFHLPKSELTKRLRRRMQVKEGKKLRLASEAYLRFLEIGGEIRMEDLSPGLLRSHLDRGRPILTGLSATYLYQAPRELGVHDDDVRGDAQGHFVVLAGYDPENDQVLVADPLGGTRWVQESHYPVGMDRLINSILLGVLTYDANLLILDQDG
jgi:hypothetical protein